MVSGLFGDLSVAILDKLLDIGVSPDEDGCILIQRTLSQDGKSRINLNGRSINLTLLKSITPLLVNIHGQSDTAALMDAKNHLDLLDTFADINDLKKEYQKAYFELEEIRNKINEITASSREAERMKEILEYQIKDIDAVSPKAGEEDDLFERKLKIKNSEKITKNSEFVYKALKGSEKGSVSFLLDRSVTALSQISDVVPQYSEFSERLRDVLYQIEDVAEEVYAVIEDMDGGGEDSLNQIEDRLDKITRLKRKYGLTVEAVLAFRDKAEKDLDALENSDSILRELSRKEEIAYCKALELAEKLHDFRAKAALVLEDRVKETLEFLDMPKVVFFASIKEEYAEGKKVLNKDGADRIEFYISANRGADAQPLSKIASGGELSRIMLALKSVIADKDGIPTVIYDEIDAGVSGKTARKIGIKMLDLSRSAQLFCVTHSAQIASLADAHYLISKSDVNGATETSVVILDREGRIKELSRILGGIDITDAQRAAAEDMLAEKEGYVQGFC